MALVTVPFGQSRRAPKAHRLKIGLTWENRIGRPPNELDLWIARIHTGGSADIITWAKEEWHRPALGRDSNDNPHVATPELDVVYYSDDPDQRLAYQKVAAFDLSQTPQSVTGYGVFAAVYDPEFTGLTLGSVKDVRLSLIDPASGNELQTQPFNYPWARSLAIAALNRDANGNWHMVVLPADKCASIETMYQVCQRFNAS